MESFKDGFKSGKSYVFDRENNLIEEKNFLKGFLEGEFHLRNM